MRTLTLLLVPVVMTLSGCAGWVVFGHTIEGQRPQSSAVAPPASTTDHPYAAQPAPEPPPVAVPSTRVLKSVTVSFTPAAREKIAAEPQFKEDRLLAVIESELRAHKLFDDSDSHATGTLEVSIDDFATRPLSNAVVFGYVLGNGTLAGHIEVHNADGKGPRDSRINAGSRVEKPISAEQSNAFGPLYRKFADLTVDSLNSAYE
jgi:hypothetical protein